MTRREDLHLIIEFLEQRGAVVKLTRPDRDYVIWIQTPRGSVSLVGRLRAVEAVARAVAVGYEWGQAMPTTSATRA